MTYTVYKSLVFSAKLILELKSYRFRHEAGAVFGDSMQTGLVKVRSPVAFISKQS